jgi:hypothetical protein
LLPNDLQKLHVRIVKKTSNRQTRGEIMAIQKQISVVQQNRVGELARLCATLAEKKVNILAFCIYDLHEYGVLRMIVDDVSKASEAIQAAKIPFSTTDVVAVELAHKPGALAGAAKKLADAGINIDYGYASATKDQSLLVLKVSDPAKADRALA